VPFFFPIYRRAGLFSSQSPFDSWKVQTRHIIPPNAGSPLIFPTQPSPLIRLSVKSHRFYCNHIFLKGSLVFSSASCLSYTPPPFFSPRFSFRRFSDGFPPRQEDSSPLPVSYSALPTLFDPFQMLSGLPLRPPRGQPHTRAALIGFSLPPIFLVSFSCSAARSDLRRILFLIHVLFFLIFLIKTMFVFER